MYTFKVQQEILIEVDLRTINTAKKTRFSSTIQGSSKMTEGVFFISFKREFRLPQR